MDKLLPRILINDIFKAIIFELGAMLKEIIIHNFMEAGFHAWLTLVIANMKSIKKMPA